LKLLPSKGGGGNSIKQQIELVKGITKKKVNVLSEILLLMKYHGGQMRTSGHRVVRHGGATGGEMIRTTSEYVKNVENYTPNGLLSTAVGGGLHGKKELRNRMGRGGRVKLVKKGTVGEQKGQNRFQRESNDASKAWGGAVPTGVTLPLKKKGFIVGSTPLGRHRRLGGHQTHTGYMTVLQHIKKENESSRLPFEEWV